MGSETNPTYFQLFNTALGATIQAHLLRASCSGENPVKYCYDQQGDVEEAVETARVFADRAYEALTKRELLVKRQAAEIRELKERLDRCAHDGADDLRRIKVLERRLQEVTAERDQYKAERDELRGAAAQVAAAMAEPPVLVVEGPSVADRIEESLKADEGAKIDALQARLMEQRECTERALEKLNSAVSEKTLVADKLSKSEDEVKKLRHDLECVRRNVSSLCRANDGLRDDNVALRSEVERLRRRKDEAYTERNALVAGFVWLANTIGWKSGVGTHEDKPGEDWDPEWRTLVTVETPCGQMSWHFHDSHKPWVAGLPSVDSKWDGHTTEEKYRRLARLVGASFPNNRGE